MKQRLIIAMFAALAIALLPSMAFAESCEASNWFGSCSCANGGKCESTFFRNCCECNTDSDDALQQLRGLSGERGDTTQYVWNDERINHFLGLLNALGTPTASDLRDVTLAMREATDRGDFDFYVVLVQHHDYLMSLLSEEELAFLLKGLGDSA